MYKDLFSFHEHLHAHFVVSLYCWNGSNIYVWGCNMYYGHACENAECPGRNRRPNSVDPDAIKCPACGNTDLVPYRFPENGDDVKILRDDYNRRMAAKDVNFTPSVGYNKDGTPIVN